RAFRNDGGSFTELTGAADPFAGVYVGGLSAPSFADLDGDGDSDMIVGSDSGTFRVFRNDDGTFTELTGAANPFAGIVVGAHSKPSFADLDGDGDLDLVVGGFYGTLRTWRNDAGTFTELTGAGNPFDGIDVGFLSTPAFGDVDGDGDLDLVVGSGYGTLRTWRNDGGTFSELSGAANPLDGIDVGASSKPAFVDIDGDGDADLVVGGSYGTFRVFRNDGGTFSELTGAS
ncbi:MAG: FG-GAP-like repeat-containing protein, partial [Saprospiraceae bacterium]